MTIDLNSDMGELPDSCIEEALMRFVTSASIACGGHIGDEASMMRTVRLALAHDVAIGAHPSYPDRENFGRVEIPLASEQIERTVCEQVTALAAVAAALGSGLAHVKPHGALYNVAARDPAVAEAIARGVARYSNSVVLVGLAGSQMLDVWRKAGFDVAAEAFADRRYEPDGSLRSRKLADALITDPDTAATQAIALARRGDVQTICIHSDTPQSVAIAEAVASALDQAGITRRRLPAHGH